MWAPAEDTGEKMEIVSALGWASWQILKFLKPDEKILYINVLMELACNLMSHSDLRHLLLEQEHQILHPPSSPQEATLLQRAEPTPIYTTPVSLKRAPSSPSDYQVNKTYLRRSRCVSSEWKQIPRSSHAILRQTCVSFEKVFRLQLSWAPSNSDCNTHGTQTPRASPWFKYD